jgi:hypothetical protein
MDAATQVYPGPIVCCVPDCAGDWCACAPGTEADDARQGNLFVIAPAAEVPLVAWCAIHLPWLRREGVA